MKRNGMEYRTGARSTRKERKGERRRRRRRGGKRVLD